MTLTACQNLAKSDQRNYNFNKIKTILIENIRELGDNMDMIDMYASKP